MKRALLYISLTLSFFSSLLFSVDYTWDPNNPTAGAFWNNQGGVENWTVAGVKQANFPSTATDTAIFNNVFAGSIFQSANIVVNKMDCSKNIFLNITSANFTVGFSGVAPMVTGTNFGTIFACNSQIIFNSDFTFDSITSNWGGGLTGVGGLTLTNGATLILADPEKIVDYTGVTLINAGCTLDFTDVVVQGTAQITNNGTLHIESNPNGNTRTLSRPIAGTGTVTFGESGSLGAVVLNGALTYTGTTNIIASSVELKSPAGATLAGNLTGAGQLIINSGGQTFAFTGSTLNLSGPTALTAGTLSLRPSQSTNFRSSISGAGNLDLQPSANNVLTLSGSQAQTGATTISGAGSCTFTSMPTATSGISIAAGSLLTLSPTSNATFNRSVTGDGNLAVSAPNQTVTFAGTFAHTGPTLVTAGDLRLNGTLTNSSVTTSANGILTGTGSVTNTVNNRATVMPGLSTSGNLTVGTYTPTRGGTLRMNLSPTSSPQLLPTTANLNGTLLLSLETGIYTKGLTYRVLTATNPINNDFSNFKVVHADTGVPEVGSWSRQTVGGNVIQVTVTEHHVVTPTALEALQGNDRTIAHYMFDTPGLLLASPDLTAVANQMLALDGTAFKSALVRVSPLPYAANPQVGLQNNIQMAVILDKQYKEQVEKSRIQTHSDPDATNGPPLFADPQTGFFIEPIGMYIDQRQTGGSLSDVGQVPFEAFTYGAGIGYEKVLQDKFVVEAGVGYTHSNLNWRQDFGHARWSTVYIAPFFGWFDKVAYGNGMIMGGFNFHNTSRNILFNGFNRTATSSYATFDILLRVNGGVRGYLGNDWWIQPDGTLNYLTIFTPQYSEKGAGSINLVVRSRSSFIMQPSFRAYFIRELFRGDLYYAPKLYIGWLANILLNKDNVEARFEGAPSRIFFTIQGFTKTINQLVLGAEMYALKHEKFNFTASFEADLLQKLSVYTLKAKYEWMF